MSKTREKKTQKQKVKSNPFFGHRHIYNIIIFCFCFFLYGNTIKNDYNLDDELVTNHHRFTSQGFAGIPDIIKSAYYADNMGYSYEYRPVVHISFAIENQFFGDNPHVGHLANVILYALLCISLFYLFVRLTGAGRLFTLLILLLFAAHPIHTEVVCSLKNRDELLALFFAALGSLYYLKYYEGLGIPNLVIGIAFMAISLLSKLTTVSMAILVPVLLILFKGTDFKKIAVIYFFTILPAFFLEPIATVRSKFQLFTTTALPVIAFALAINYRSVLIFMKDRWQHVFTGIAKYKQPQNQSDADSFIMSEFFRVENILPTLLLMVAGVVLIWYQLYYGAVIVQLILIWLYYTANKYIKWYALVFFVFISLLFKSVLYVLGSEYSVLLQYFIIVILLDVGMVYAAPMLFFLLAHIMLYGGFKDIFRAIFSVILFLGKSRLANKYRLFMLVVMIVLAGINLIKHNPEWRVSTFGIGVLLFGLIVIFNELAFKNKAPVRLVGTLIIPFYVLVCLISAGVQLKPVVKSEWFTHAQAVSQKSETIADSTLKKVGFVSNRPLGYVEAPVKGKDPVGIQIGTSLVVLGKYLKLVIVPFPLLFYYGYRLIEPTQFLSFPAIGSLIAYIALVITGIYFIRREKLITAGIMWYIISVAPFSNLTNLLPGVMGERYLLVPSFGITILVIALIFRFFKLDKQSEAVSTINKLKYVLLPVLMILSGEVISRNMQWKDDLTLMRHDVQYADNGANVHNILALHLMQYSTTEPNPVNRTAIEKEALFHFKRALSIYPQYFNVAYDIGRVYTALNMPDSAIVAYKYALAIDTTYPNLHQNLAELLINAGRDSEAIPSLIFMVHDEPTIYNHYSRLSYSYYKLKQFEKAIEVNRLAMIHTPAAAEAATNIGRTYVAMNLPDSALFYYNTARKLVPGDSAAQHFINNLETELKNKK